MTTTRTRRARRAAVLAGIAGLVAAALLTGCAGSGDSGDSSDALSSAGDVSVAEQPAAPDSVQDAAPAGRYGSDAGALSDDELAGDARPASALEVATPAVISTGTVSLVAEDVGKARFDIRRIVDRFRGIVTEQETTTGEKGEVSTARLVIRVPGPAFSDAQSALEEVATLTGSTSGAEDVTGEVLDIEARVRAQRKSVERIEALLARAGSLQQVVSIESQLATRQGDLDALMARQKWLADQTSLSTLTVYVEQPGEKEAGKDTEEGGFLGGLREGWDSFVDGGVAVLTVLGFVLPWLGLALLLGLPLWLALRRRTHRANSAPAAPTA